MQGATASTSDISAQTASRGCCSTKDWERRCCAGDLLDAAGGDADRRWRGSVRRHVPKGSRRLDGVRPRVAAHARRGPWGRARAPAMRAWTSLRGVRQWCRPGVGRVGHDRLDGVDDAHVAGAAAEVAAHLVADLGARQPALAAHEIARGNQHAGRTVAALQRVRLGEGRRRRAISGSSSKPSMVRTSAPSQVTA